LENRITSRRNDFLENGFGVLFGKRR